MHTTPTEAGLFSIKRKLDPTKRPVLRAAAGMLDRLLALDELSRIYADAVADLSGRPFVDRCLAAVPTAYELPDVDRSRIPTTGPLVVVSNHCFGGIEGLILLSILQSVRPDVRVMANYLLQRIPELRTSFIFVDPFGRPDAPRVNSGPLRESIRQVKQGGVLGVFPSGEVARLDLRQRAVTEPAWSETVAGVVRAAEAPVLPIFFDGFNSPMFHLAGLVHPRLRTAMLPRELTNKRDRRLQVRIGHVIPYARLARFTDNHSLMDHLRTRTYLLRNRVQEQPATGTRLPRLFRLPRQDEPIAPAMPDDTLIAEVAALPAGQLLTSMGEFDVWFARAPQIPSVLLEIGRLREITFRAVGEGGGHARDLDRFDATYVHLFMWHRLRNELVGAYRIGPTDEILPQAGRRGLYTSTLFRMNRDLLDTLNPALELGRSFVRKEYQRNYQSLYLIWKGIAEYVMRAPRYRILFGPVSISSQYRSVSRDLLVTFLRMNSSLPDLARSARPRKPVRTRRQQPGVPDPVSKTSSLDDIEELIADVESDLRGAPILLKQYLKLGGRILGFNRDPKFGNCLDGLIVVDLVTCNHKVLGRYMGDTGLRAYLNHHQGTAP